MTNFCGNCGTVVPEGSAVCPNCGAVVAAAAPEATKANPLEAIKGKKNIIVGVVAVVVVILLAILLFGNSPKSVAKKYLKAQYKTFKAKPAVSTMHKKYVEYVADQNDQTRKEYIEDMQEYYDDSKDNMNDSYDKWSVSYKITDVKDVKNSECKALKEFYDDELGLKIKKVKEVKYKATLKYKEDGDKDQETDKGSVYVAKIGGKWYRVSMYVPNYDKD